MARPALHQPAAIIDATFRLASRGLDAVTIAAVARQSGAPSGSIYHRFGSRDGLLAAAWLEATHSFQEGFVRALREETAIPGLAAARHTTGWARRAPHPARALVLHGAQDFGATRWPDGARERARDLARELEDGLAEFSHRRFGDSGGELRRRVTFALLDLPLAAVRRYLAAGIAPPEEVDGYLHDTLAALLGGDRN
jgi:AcrR family transcriptional regulator